MSQPSDVKRRLHRPWSALGHIQALFSRTFPYGWLMEGNKIYKDEWKIHIFRNWRLLLESQFLVNAQKVGRKCRLEWNIAERESVEKRRLLTVQIRWNLSETSLVWRVRWTPLQCTSNYSSTASLLFSGSGSEWTRITLTRRGQEGRQGLAFDLPPSSRPPAERKTHPRWAVSARDFLM